MVAPLPLQRLQDRIDKLELERTRLLALVEILREISGAYRYASIVQAVVRRMGHLFGLERCSVLLASRAGGHQVYLVASFEDGRFGDVRLAAGAIGPRARRLPTAEAALSGRRLEASTLRGFIAALADEVDAAIPGRSSQPWKRRAIAGLGVDLIARFSGTSPRERMFEEALQ